MKINIDKTTIQKTSDAIRKALNKVKFDVGDYAKDAYNSVKDTADFVVQEVELRMPSKLERLKKNVESLESKHYAKFVVLKNAEKFQKEDPYTVYKLQKEFELMTKQLQKATEEYNTFAARQKMAQQAFDRLNNF